jgi:hypothetical protein
MSNINDNETKSNGSDFEIVNDYLDDIVLKHQIAKHMNLVHETELIRPTLRTNPINSDEQIFDDPNFILKALAVSKDLGKEEELERFLKNYVKICFANQSDFVNLIRDKKIDDVSIHCDKKLYKKDIAEVNECLKNMASEISYYMNGEYFVLMEKENDDDYYTKLIHCDKNSDAYDILKKVCDGKNEIVLTPLSHDIIANYLNIHVDQKLYDVYLSGKFPYHFNSQYKNVNIFPKLIEKIKPLVAILLKRFDNNDSVFFSVKLHNGKKYVCLNIIEFKNDESFNTSLSTAFWDYINCEIIEQVYDDYNYSFICLFEINTD